MDRRVFFRGTMLAGLLAGLGLVPAEATPGSDCEKLIADNSIRAKKAEMAEKAGLFRRLIKKYGDGVIHDVRQYVEETTCEKVRKASIPKRDLAAIRKVIWESMGKEIEYAFVEHTYKRLRVRVTRCLYAEKMREHGEAALGHAFYCAWDDGFCRGFHPGLKFTRTRTLMAGDDHCDHTYEL